MNVTCKVSLTDDERNKMFRSLNGNNGKGMVSRADVNTFVKAKSAEVLNGVTAEIKQVVPGEAKVFEAPKPTRVVENFEPSRGDEPYLFKAKNESLREIHTRMLNLLEEYEAAVWADMEKNRRD